MKFYAVVRGRRPGIYVTWEDCNAQISGFPRALFKKFPTVIQAEEFFSQFKFPPPSSPRSRRESSDVAPQHSVYLSAVPPSSEARFIIKDPAGKVVAEQKMYLGESTTPGEIGYYALILSMVECLHRQIVSVSVFSDSVEVVQQKPSGEIEDSALSLLAQRVETLQSQFSSFNIVKPLQQE